MTTRERIIQRCRAAKACSPEFAKLISAKTNEEFYRVICQNMLWVLKNSIISNWNQFARYADWEKLSGWSWSLLLPDQPQFAEYADWEKLNMTDWNWLLIYQPQFEKYRKEEA